jgi:hypothetical protein
MKALILAKSATMTEMSSPEASSPFFFSQYKSGTLSPLENQSRRSISILFYF